MTVQRAWRLFVNNAAPAALLLTIVGSVSAGLYTFVSAHWRMYSLQKNFEVERKALEEQRKQWQEKHRALEERLESQRKQRKQREEQLQLRQKQFKSEHTHAQAQHNKALVNVKLESELKLWQERLKALEEKLESTRRARERFVDDDDDEKKKKKTERR